MSIEDDVALFERTPVLRLLGRDALRIVSIGAESRFIHEGEILFQSGEPAEGAYVVQQGSFALLCADGSERMASTGTLLGDLALLVANARPDTALAREPSTVIRIPRGMFLKVLEGYPDAALRLRDALSLRIEAATQEISDVGRLFRDKPA